MKSTRPHEDLVAAADTAAQSSPHYGATLAEWRLKPDRTWTDCPMTAAADLVRHGSDFATRSAVTVFASSGTAHSAKPAFFSPRDQGATVRRTTASLIACGARAGTVLVVAHGFGIWLIGSDFTAAGGELGLRVLPIGKGPGMTHTLLLLRQFGAEVIATSPSYALRLARQLSSGSPARHLGTRMLLLSGETVSAGLRESLRRAWGLEQVHSFYGSAELGHVGCDPGADGRIRLSPEFAYEVLVDSAPVPLAPGARGELVVTTLYHEGMPLVRYRTGDLVELTSVRQTGAGIELEAAILGRIAASVVFESGEKLWCWQLEDLLLGGDPRISDFRAEVDESSAENRQWFPVADRLTVYIATAGDVPLSADECDVVAARLRDVSLDMSAVGESVEFDVRWVPADKLAEHDRGGKPQRLVDRRGSRPG